MLQTCVCNCAQNKKQATFWVAFVFLKTNKCFIFCTSLLYKSLTRLIKIIYNFLVKYNIYFKTIKSARGTDPTKAQQPLVKNEKGANFRKKS